MNQKKRNWSLRSAATGLVLAAGLMASPAMAQIMYSEDFEGVDIGSPTALGDAGWLIFANVFTDYPGCSAYEYGYGVFPAPNGGGGFSSVVVGGTGQAMNTFSDYNNGDHAVPKCIETSVFQERAFTMADVGDYTFSFDMEVPAPPDDVLGPNVTTFGFIKVLDPNNGFSLDLFLTVDTATAGTKTIDVTLDDTVDGKLVQWGFSTLAGNYDPSGRWYDNISFEPQAVAPPEPPEPPVEPPAPPPNFVATPVPTLGDLGMLLMVLLVGLIGGTVLLRR